MERLSTEIIQAIASWLRDDQPSLANMNLVCRHWHHATRSCLYHSPQLNSIDQLLCFIDTLNEPQSKYVREIDLQLIPHRWRMNMGPILKMLTSKAPKIEHLWIGMCLIDQDIISAVTALSNLKTFSAPECRVDDDTLIPIVQHCPLLEGIDLTLSYVSDSGLEAIATHCKQLEWLDITGSQQISEKGLLLLSKQCLNLRHVNIQDCYNVVSGTYGTIGDLPDHIDWLPNEDNSPDTEDE